MDWFSWAEGAAAATFLTIGVVKLAALRDGRASDRYFRSVGEVADAIAARALALSSTEGPLAPRGTPPAMTAEQWLARDPGVSRAGVPERVAVYDPLVDRCDACGHSLGAPGVYGGIPFALCQETRSGALCGHYRSTILLTDQVMQDQRHAAREAMLRLHFPRPAIISDDEDVQTYWRTRPPLIGAEHNPDLRLADMGEGRTCAACTAPQSCTARGRCRIVMEDSPREDGP